jgi:hypothetical protein
MSARRRVSRHPRHNVVALFLVHLLFHPNFPDQLTTDPNAPKRGLSAYMFFANEQRDNVREENPGISFGM